MSKGEKTKERIVAKAASVFNQHGFAGSSMTELMEATGLEKGGLYRHFPSKEAIAVEAFDYAWRSASDTRTHDLDLVPNRVDRLKQFVSNFVERRPVVPGGCPLFNTAIDSDDGNPLLRERAREALREWLDRLQRTVDEGIAAGEIRSGVDARRLATLMISALEGALTMSRLEKDRAALLSMKAFLHDHLESQVRSPRK